MRIAVHTRVRADRIAGYERAHADVPAELVDAIRAADQGQPQACSDQADRLD